MMSLTQKNTILSVVNVFETGTASGKYDKISVYRDGPVVDGKRVYQITYGRAQTTEFGNLKRLIEQYISRNGRYGSQFQPFLNKIGRHPSLRSNTLFRELLKKSAIDDVIMKTVQDDFFDLYYYQPANVWFDGFGFTEALSLLVIYDSFIHSGRIREDLRQKFSERPPKFGGNERTWIEQYVNVRHQWLSTHTNEILRATVYRTNCFKKEIKKNNWDLAQPINANGITIP
jgi:chitosanase